MTGLSLSSCKILNIPTNHLYEGGDPEICYENCIEHRPAEWELAKTRSFKTWIKFVGSHAMCCADPPCVWQVKVQDDLRILHKLVSIQHRKCEVLKIVTISCSSNNSTIRWPFGGCRGGYRVLLWRMGRTCYSYCL